MNYITLFFVAIIIKIEYYYDLLYSIYIIIMSNNEIIIQMHIKNKRVAYLNISHNNIINRIWYYLYKLDQIMLKDDVNDKAREILEEPVNDNNYLEY